MDICAPCQEIQEDITQRATECQSLLYCVFSCVVSEMRMNFSWNLKVSPVFDGLVGHICRKKREGLSRESPGYRDIDSLIFSISLRVSICFLKRITKNNDDVALSIISGQNSYQSTADILLLFLRSFMVAILCTVLRCCLRPSCYSV